ncbi:MAG TPA: CAP domain-containing protein [Leptolyngbyaceae cyanobacterium]
MQKSTCVESELSNLPMKCEGAILGDCPHPILGPLPNAPAVKKHPTPLAIKVAQALSVLLLTGCTAIEQLPTKLPAILSTGGTTAPAPSSTTTVAQAEATSQMEAQVFAQINTIRQQQGLSELRQNDKLAQVARDYSRRMAEGDFFAHTSPQGDTMVERVHAAGIFYFMLGENLFTSTNIPQPANAAVKGWMNSPGHRENILRQEYRETGIGVWRRGNTYYFTQLFMRSL